MKVLILGGTGFFGRDIVEIFKKAGHAISTFNHASGGDRRNSKDLEKAAAPGWDLVIDNLGYTRADMEVLVGAFRGKTKRLTFTSTVSVYRYTKTRFYQPLQEGDIDFQSRPNDEDPTNVHWQYARGKLEAEAFLASSGIPCTVFRPSPVYGPHDNKHRIFWYLARIQSGGPILLADGGAHSFRLCYSRDIAQAYLAAAERPESVGKTFYLAQEEIVTLKEVLESSAEALKTPVEFISMPLDYLGDLAGPLGNLINFVPDIRRAKEELGYRPTPFTEFIPLTAKWFRDEWKGKTQELLATRDQELALAQKWKNKVQPLFT